MLSHISWIEFWQCIAVAVIMYYLFIGVCYYQEELKALFNKRKLSPVTEVSHSPTQASMIGSFNTEADNDTPGNVPDELVEQTLYEYPESGDEYIHMEEDTILSESLLSDIEAGLEDEPVLYHEPTIIADLPLNGEISMDSDDFLMLIQEGIDSLDPEKRQLMYKIANEEDTILLVNEDFEEEIVMEELEPLYLEDEDREMDQEENESTYTNTWEDADMADLNEKVEVIAKTSLN